MHSDMYVQLASPLHHCLFALTPAQLNSMQCDAVLDLVFNERTESSGSDESPGVFSDEG